MRSKTQDCPLLCLTCGDTGWWSDPTKDKLQACPDCVRGDVGFIKWAEAFYNAMENARYSHYRKLK